MLKIKIPQNCFVFLIIHFSYATLIVFCTTNDACAFKKIYPDGRYQVKNEKIRWNFRHAWMFFWCFVDHQRCSTAFVNAAVLTYHSTMTWKYELYSVGFNPQKSWVFNKLTFDLQEKRAWRCDGSLVFVECMRLPVFLVWIELLFNKYCRHTYLARNAEYVSIFFNIGFKLA